MKMKPNILRRQTIQRKIILEELKRVKTHPTADGIFTLVRKTIPTITFGTVYRNLNLLRDAGKILELTCGRYSCRYDGDASQHYHFFCLKCKNVFDARIPAVENLDRKVSQKLKFQVKYHRIEFYGYCQKCKAKI